MSRDNLLYRYNCNRNIDIIYRKKLDYTANEWIYHYNIHKCNTYNGEMWFPVIYSASSTKELVLEKIYLYIL